MTRARRRMVPAKILGQHPPVGSAEGRRCQDHHPDAMPISGVMSRSAGQARFAATLTPTATIRISPTMRSRIPSIFRLRGGRLRTGEWRCCWRAAGTAEDQKSDDRRKRPVQDHERADTVDPHHGRGRIADDAARSAGVRCRHDCRQIGDVDFSLEDVAGHRPADECGGDVVEKGGENEDDAEERKARQPAPRQERRHLVGKPARFEMAREDGEAHQEQEQVGQRPPIPARGGERARSRPLPEGKPVKASL